MTDNTKAVRVIISGRVQGVWFRAWTQEEAEKLGLSGWVCNRHDGRVEALFQGAAHAVNQMLGKLWGGPPSSKVTEVAEALAEPEDVTGFEVRPSV